MITASQLRAARGMLDWTRSTLAKASGLSAETIKNIEHGIYTPQESSIDAIVRAFAENDVEFTDGDGVRTRKNRVMVFSGKNGYENFLDHVYSVMKKGGAIRQFNISDGTHLLPYAKDTAAEHLRRMGNIRNLDARVLTAEGDYNFPATYCEYKWLDKSSEKLIPYYVFNDYISMLIFKNDKYIETISIHSKMLAELYNDQFSQFWNSAKTPNKKHRK
ncbi:MAG TPA: hypothetical protein DD400_05930 [Rhodospirillaceae bacterium]|nr:hypothetical protein [Rhodospirillaceae bacterium]